MSCPPEIASILLRMIYHGLLKIRNGVGSLDLCQIEADHLHNLPDLVRDYHADALIYYWDCERASYLRLTPEGSRGNYEELWEELRPHVEAARLHEQGA